MLLDSEKIWKRLEKQVALGPRFVGTAAHASLHQLLGEWLGTADRFVQHTFEDVFFGQTVRCRNFWARYHGDAPGRLLLGTHFDTRPYADRDSDVHQQRQAVLGANDGASGTALLCELTELLKHNRQRPTIDIVCFDAEDWHDIDGKEVSLGARRFVEDLEANEKPDAVLVVDMVAGKNLMLDVDVNCQQHDLSYDFTLNIFRLGRALGLPCFALAKSHPYKWVGCDHTPFMSAGMPSAILIDLDYPPWHTTQDSLEQCDPGSLAQIGRFLCELVYTHKGLLNIT